LLLVATPVRGDFPAKLFPYLAAGRPILTLATPLWPRVGTMMLKSTFNAEHHPSRRTL